MTRHKRELNLILKVVTHLDEVFYSIESDPIAKAWFSSSTEVQKNGKAVKTKPIRRSLENARQNLEALLRIHREEIVEPR